MQLYINGLNSWPKKEFRMILNYLVASTVLLISPLLIAGETTSPRDLEDYDAITCHTEEECGQLARYHKVTMDVLCNYHRCAVIIKEDRKTKDEERK